MTRGRRLDPTAFLVALPAYAGSAVLLVEAALQFARGTQPGETPADPRPMGHVSDAMAALVAGLTLLFLGYFAAKRPAQSSSLLTTACSAAVAALLLLLGGLHGHSSVLLAVAAGFAYPALIATGRLVSLRFHQAAEERT